MAERAGNATNHGDAKALGSVGRVTVLGSTGFIGSHLCGALRLRGIDPITPARDEVLTGRDLGTVYYCIGMTADYRKRPFDTVEAHVCKLNRILRDCQFDSLVYLSSTKVFLNAATTAEETTLVANPSNPEEIMAISKMMGESLCLNCGRPNVRVARPSNVLGDDFASDNFLFSLIRDALRGGHILLRSDLDSAKDYIFVDDVVEILLAIGTRGRDRIYNVASGSNLTHRALVAAITQATGCTVAVAEGAPRIVFPEIEVDRVNREFSRESADVIGKIPRLIEDYRRWLTTQEGTTTGA